MRKGKYNIYLSFYAILAFILAILGQTLLTGLVLGFVIVAEKDEWTSRQCMQAFFLALISGILSPIRSIVALFDAIPILNTIVSGIFGFISGIISLVILIFAIIGLVQVCKGKEANIPGLSNLAGKAFGIVKKVSYNNVANGPVNGNPNAAGFNNANGVNNAPNNFNNPNNGAN